MLGNAIGWGSLFLTLTALPSQGQTAEFLEEYTDWSAYKHSAPTNKVCFVVAQPKDRRPKKIQRGPVYFYVSHWPDDKVRNEINIRIGYPFRKDSRAELTIGKAKFNLFTKDQAAWVASASQEKKIVEAMRKGSLMIVQGRSSKGTLTTDRYSLSGVSAALDRIDKECS